MSNSIKIHSTLNKLLVETSNNDNSAFQKLYKKASPKLFSLSLRLMAYDNEAAEEVLQEAFIKIWNKADKYSPDQGLAIAWMGRIVRNQAFDRLRSYKSRPELIQEADYVTIEYMTKDLEPELQNSYTQQISIFKQLLEKLPKKQQECITNSVVYGLSHSEIAKKMKIPLGTVKSCINRNMKDIKDAMSDPRAFGCQ